DKPPKPANLLSPDWMSGHMWVFGTVPLVQRLSEALSARENGTSNDGDPFAALPANLLNTLLQLWGAPHKRAFRRQAGQAVVDVCFGADRIARMLGSDGKNAAARKLK